MPCSRLSTIVAAGLLVVSLPLLADSKADTQDLMACVYENLDEERAKPAPSTDELIKTCNAEYVAFVARIPPGLVDDVTADFRRQITAALEAN